MRSCDPLGTEPSDCAADSWRPVRRCWSRWWCGRSSVDSGSGRRASRSSSHGYCCGSTRSRPWVASVYPWFLWLWWCRVCAPVLQEARKERGREREGEHRVIAWVQIYVGFFFFVYLQSTGRQFWAWVYLLSKFFFIKAKNSDECVGVMLLLLIFLFGISQIVVEVILCLHFPFWNDSSLSHWWECLAYLSR